MKQRTGMRSGFGATLKRLRVAAGLSQPELGKLANLHHTYISQLETGQRKRPSYPTLSALASALGVTVADIAGPEIAADLSPEVVQIAREIAELPPPRRQMAARMIRLLREDEQAPAVGGESGSGSQSEGEIWRPAGEKTGSVNSSQAVKHCYTCLIAPAPDVDLPLAIWPTEIYAS